MNDSRVPLIPILALILALPAVAVAEPTASPAWPSGADDVVLRYRVEALRGADPGPSLTLYGDGTVRLHRPAYRADGGDAELRLGRAEMADLLAALLADGVAEIDLDALRSRVDDARRERLARGEVVPHRAGAATSVLELRLDAPEPVDRRIAWRGLRADAAAFADIAPLVRLSSAEARLLSLFDDPRQVPISAEAG